MIYIALMRGINVGGNNMIKMAELRVMCEEMGLSQVKTYINSGNVLFESEGDSEPLRRRIEQQITETFGISSTVVLRTAEELAEIIAKCPFRSDALSAGESIHVSLSNTALSQAQTGRLASLDRGGDEYHINGREVYFLYHRNVMDSMLAKNFVKVGGAGTMRNWKTIMKLSAIVEAMKA